MSDKKLSKGNLATETPPDQPPAVTYSYHDFFVLLLPVMAKIAQCLEWSSPELGYIAAMPLDVIADELRRVAFKAPAEPAD